MLPRRLRWQLSPASSPSGGAMMLASMSRFTPQVSHTACCLSICLSVCLSHSMDLGWLLAHGMHPYDYGPSLHMPSRAFPHGHAVSRTPPPPPY
jgi:hypothetical protein